MFSLIDMTQLTPEKNGFLRVHLNIIHYWLVETWNLIGNYFLGYRMRIKVISGLVKPGV